MDYLISVLDAWVPSSGQGMTLLLLVGIALMALLFIFVGKLNRELIAEIEMKRKVRNITRSALPS